MNWNRKPEKKPDPNTVEVKFSELPEWDARSKREGFTIRSVEVLRCGYRLKTEGRKKELAKNSGPGF